MMRIIALVIATLFFVTACQTTENIGTGPISNMSETTINGYRNYLRVKTENEHYNMAFAYNRTTRAHGWSGTHQQHGIGYTIGKAMENCEKATAAGVCKVLDIDGQIVWQGLDGNLIARLLEPLPVIYDTQTYEYEANSYRISAAQLKKFKSTLKHQKDYDFTAFFISADGKSTGASYISGHNSSGHASSISDARKKCQIASPEARCYHFATNGEPVNADARADLDRLIDEKAPLTDAEAEDAGEKI